MIISVLPWSVIAKKSPHFIDQQITVLTLEMFPREGNVFRCKNNKKIMMH